MSEAFVKHTFEILTMLLVAFLLGVLLGYILWYKWRRLYIDLQREHDRLTGLHRDLEKDHASLRYKAEETDKENHKLHQRVLSLDGDVAIWKTRFKKCEEEKGLALGAAGPPPDPDDLKKIEGIGPKIEQLCNQIGIYTWRQLASTSVEKLQKMLDDAGPNYRIANPGTWPRQAEMAANGDWDKLKEYQDFLIGGTNPDE